MYIKYKNRGDSLTTVKANEASCEGEYAANESRKAGKQAIVSVKGQAWSA